MIDEVWIKVVIHLGLILVASVLGLPGNVLSAVVFYRQGLRERINLCLFAHALIDLLVDLLYLLDYSERIYKLLEKSPLIIAETMHGLAGAVWASQLLSAVIASERCFCVVSPFHAKRLLKTSTMAAIIVVCSLFLIGGMMAVVGPKFISGSWLNHVTNLTESSLTPSRFYLENRLIIDILDIYVYGFAISGIFLSIVLISTSITIVKLRAAVAWRTTATSGMTTTSAMTTTSVTDHGGVIMSSKNLSVTLMLTVTSMLFLVHVTPNIFVQICLLTLPEWSQTLHPVSTLLWHIVEFLWTLNSSVNFIVYYKMGKKFRESLKQLF